ncbi:1-deoxy-D-xylulose-5-phosphate reductoisomerase [Brevibacterium yomogidense]|uniref:1-deoxy-D-xylulose 5-phosphate reductoisomerase n=1 Tax=Brevibacterium yomogidense TaxID=946573 RepID=A0A1X6XJU1_9MICO|nr:1-deoxy-D-xylulose-5-phosphate reductoisomerase [Brevibacterium yomogidense]SLM99595.1 1-deoxy-D-xylulose 5-phosphate reductoisomerase [Brevibacterium yomogidense]
MTVRRLSVIGATGSIGTQARDVLRLHRGRFRVTGLAAGGNLAELAAQAVEFSVPAIGLALPPAGTAAEARAAIRSALASEAARQSLPDPVEVIEIGPEAPAAIAALPTDVVLNAVTGAAGLDGTLAALEASTDVALANKESLIIGGDVVLGAAAASGAKLIPVDSEHSAIAQALRAGRADEVSKLIVTASGGPFRGFTREQLMAVTPEQALAHPTWDMGRVVTTNSAGLVNKGLEVIEAHLLFGIPYERIEVVVHPQSQVHSMVEFTDGSTIAQVSPPDMRLPIAYALGAGERISSGAPANDWTRASTWTFEPVDHEAFPALGLAVDAGRRGGTFPAVYNAANEVLVDAFHDRRIPFTGIADGIAAALAEHGRGHETDGDGFTAAEGAARSDVGRSDAATPLTREAVLAADERARVFASEWIARRTGEGAATA